MAESASKNPKQGSQLQPDNSVSSFRIYCLGTVAADFSGKSITEDPEQLLEVFFDELQAGADGRLEATGQLNEVSGKDASGRDYTAKSATTTSESCIWIPFGTGRLTAPNLRKGQRVVIWRTADDDSYYWQAKGGDDELLTIESVIFYISANPKPRAPGQKVDLNDCYYFMADSILKKFAFGTSMSNGEQGMFLGSLDLTTMILRAVGTDGGDLDSSVLSQLYVDFLERQFRFQNKDGSAIDIDKKKITIIAPDEINLIAKKLIKLVTRKVVVQAEEWEAAISNRVLWKTPLVTFTGAVQFTGVDGNTVTLNGNFVHESGSWRSPAGNNVYGHTHGGIRRGDEESDPFR